MAVALDFEPDPNGHIALTKDGDFYEAVLEDDGFQIAKFRHWEKDELVRMILMDDWISLVSHAVWLGREIERI